MWGILKGKAIETLGAIRPSLPSLPIPSSLSSLISHPTPTPNIKEAMQNAPPKKTIEELRKEEETKKVQKAWDFITSTSNEAFFKELMSKIEEYIERRKKSPTNGLKTDAEVNAERDRLIAIIFKTAELELVDEIQWAIEDEIQKVENPDKNQLGIKNVAKQIWRNTKRIIRVALFPIIGLILSSLVANEMITYPAPIRLVFFLFTLFLCTLSRFILFLIAFFYLCKWGYDYYVNEMSDGPKRLIMPTRFAFLPLTTKTYSNAFLNWLASPFQYGETWFKKDGEELKERMELYETALKESFPYVEAIKTQDPFEQQLQKIAKVFTELHQPPPPPPSVPAPLPPTIQNMNPENVARFSASSTTSPPVIAPQAPPAPQASPQAE